MSSGTWRPQWVALMNQVLREQGYASRKDLFMASEEEARRVYELVRASYPALRTGWAYQAWVVELRRLREDIGIPNAHDVRKRERMEARAREWSGGADAAGTLPGMDTCEVSGGGQE